MGVSGEEGWGPDRKGSPWPCPPPAVCSQPSSLGDCCDAAPLLSALQWFGRTQKSPYSDLTALPPTSLTVSLRLSALLSFSHPGLLTILQICQTCPCLSLCYSPASTALSPGPWTLPYLCQGFAQKAPSVRPSLKTANPPTFLMTI